MPRFFERMAQVFGEQSQHWGRRYELADDMWQLLGKGTQVKTTINVGVSEGYTLSLKSI